MKITSPLRFRPVLKRALWGGRRLGEVLRKPIGAEADYAESWEIVDHGQDQSVVDAGPWVGRTLGELTANEGEYLLGRHHPQARFPLLFKFLDCREKLSVQVHPDDACAALLDPPDLGKTEAWTILDAVPGSLIYAGLKRGFDRAALAREVNRGTCDLTLHSFEPAKGECLFLPAGVVHAPGGGLLIAEIQQASNTTFRLFDWNRTDAAGRARQLHIDQALDSIDYDYGPALPQSPRPTDERQVERLVTCEQFILERLLLTDPYAIPADERFRILAVVSGAAMIGAETFAVGETCLVPASLGGVTIVPQGQAVVLSAFLP
ncbi:MAG: class I mannose-6-phosphate isomerase [Planctomycetia bacterium]|nr:class I mannose-6-phosphate isomerase [Planctomycetia bacterium]